MGRTGLAQASAVGWGSSCISFPHLCTWVAVASVIAINCIWRSDSDILESLYLLYTLKCTSCSAVAACCSRGEGRKQLGMLSTNCSGFLEAVRDKNVMVVFKSM